MMKKNLALVLLLIISILYLIPPDLEAQLVGPVPDRYDRSPTAMRHSGKIQLHLLNL